MPSIFLSHSHQDNAFSLTIADHLRARLGDDVVWHDVSGGLHGGDDWRRMISHQIAQTQLFLVILSPEALASSWVRDEMTHAYVQYQQGKSQLLPLVYRPCELPLGWEHLDSIDFTVSTFFDRRMADLLKGTEALLTLRTLSRSLANTSQSHADQQVAFGALPCSGQMSMQSHEALEEDESCTTEQERDLVLAWLNCSSWTTERQFLEAHPGLLALRHMLEAELVGGSSTGNARQVIRKHLRVLDEAAQRGGTPEAIRHTYVNQFGGFTLDLPPWLATCLEQQRHGSIHEMQIDSPRQGVRDKRRWLVALKYARREQLPPVIVAEILFHLADTFKGSADSTDDWLMDKRLRLLRRCGRLYARSQYPEQWATVQFELGVAYQERLSGERFQNIEHAFRCFNRGRRAVRAESSPELWAKLTIGLANCYGQRLRGERAINIERALAWYRLALRVMTPENYPYEWAQIQTNLAAAYQERIAGDHAENIEMAIACYQAALTVFLREAKSLDWAMIQNNLAAAYQERIAGDHAENIEMAIACYQAALTVYTQESSPVEWATTQNNLGNAFRNRLQGEHEANQEAAIECYAVTLRFLGGSLSPRDHAMTQNNLGNVYQDRLAGERLENLEVAIACYQEALCVYNIAAFPIEWAMTQNNLGNAYRNRLVGERATNLEAAIACYREALCVYSLDSYPHQYALTNNNLGNAYSERLVGERATNLEAAIACYREALRVRTLEHFPRDYAMTQNNLGNAYSERLVGEKHANLEAEAAIHCYQEALRVYTIDHFPQDHATSQNNLGNAYRNRLAGERATNLEAAIACYREALRVFTLPRFPADHRRTQLQRALVEAEQQHWEAAHVAYQGAFEAEELLLARASGNVAGRDGVLQESRDTATRDAYVLVQLCRPDEAALTLERGRARGFAESRLLDSADPVRIRDPERRQRFIQSLTAFHWAQSLSNAPLTSDDLIRQGGLDLSLGQIIAGSPSQQDGSLILPAIERAQRKVHLSRGALLRQARETFEVAVAEVRAAGDPADFLRPSCGASTLSRAAEVGGSGHALTYLVATPWGGVAIAVCAANYRFGASSRCLSLQLPQLTDILVSDLIEHQLDKAGEDHRVIGGYGWSQTGAAFARFLSDWPGETFRARAMALHDACRAQDVPVGAATWDMAAQEVLSALITDPHYAPLLDQPLETLTGYDRIVSNALASTFNHACLRLDLAHSLSTFAKVALRPLADWLHGLGALSVTLIPCGGLSAFPLPAAVVATACYNEATGRTFADCFPGGVSVAPSAQALSHRSSGHTSAEAEQTIESLFATQRPARAGVIALGDPRPAPVALPWAEAEAVVFAKLARQAGLHADVRTRDQARRDWLLQSLSHAWIVDLACHGDFDASAPLDSALMLAQGQRLSMRELLGFDPKADQHIRMNMRGLRLLILSACQTAVIDLRGARDEARSLSAVILEAGVEAVIATLWAVDDRATWILVTRFAQIWLPQRETLSPAAALAQAQRWLRLATNAELRTWSLTLVPSQTTEEQQAASSEWIGAHLWEGRTQETDGPRPASTRGFRYGAEDAANLIRIQTHAKGDEDHPFADPFYWAGLQLAGW